MLELLFLQAKHVLNELEEEIETISSHPNYEGLRLSGIVASFTFVL